MGSYPFEHFLTLFKCSVGHPVFFFLCPFGHLYLHFSFCTSPRFSVSAHTPNVWAPAVWHPVSINNCTTIRDKSILSTAKFCLTHLTHYFEAIQVDKNAARLRGQKTLTESVKIADANNYKKLLAQCAEIYTMT